MADVFNVHIIIANPDPRTGDTGEIATGHFTLQDGVITMCDADGVPLKVGAFKDASTHKLAGGEQPMLEAKKLLRKMRDRSDDLNRFNRRLSHWRGPVV